MKTSTRNIILGIVFVLFIFNYIPGQGSKAADQKQVSANIWSCNKDSDCPKCLSSFVNITADSKCIDNKCVGTDVCIKWDCGTQNNCESVRQTVLDNIIDWCSNHLWIMLGLIILAILWYYLK